MTAIASLAMTLLFTVPPHPLPDPAVSTVTIVGIGERPRYASGIMKTSVLVLGRDEQANVRTYYLVYFGADQVLPGLGSRCTFTHQLGRLEHVGGLEITPFLIGEEFETFECGPTPPFEDLVRSEWLRQPD